MTSDPICIHCKKPVSHFDLGSYIVDKGFAHTLCYLKNIKK